MVETRRSGSTRSTDLYALVRGDENNATHSVRATVNVHDTVFQRSNGCTRHTTNEMQTGPPIRLDFPGPLFETRPKKAAPRHRERRERHRKSIVRVFLLVAKVSTVCNVLLYAGTRGEILSRLRAVSGCLGTTMIVDAHRQVLFLDRSSLIRSPKLFCAISARWSF